MVREMLFCEFFLQIFAQEARVGHWFFNRSAPALHESRERDADVCEITNEHVIAVLGPRMQISQRAFDLRFVLRLFGVDVCNEGAQDSVTPPHVLDVHRCHFAP